LSQWHEEEIVVIKNILYGILLLALISCPFVITNYWVFLLTEVLIMAIFATSFNLLLGYTGLVSFGQAAYYAVGAYTAALLIKNFSTSLWMTLAGGILSSLLVALVIGFFCVRLNRLYFSMLTMAFASMIFAIIFKWRSLTGGDDGISAIARPPLGLLGWEIPLNNPKVYYFFVLFLAGISIWIMKRIVESPLGYLLQANRDNSKRAEFIGIPIRSFRLIAFVIAGLFAGLAGSLYALLAGFVSPEIAFWAKSGDPVMMSLIGGFHSFFGPTLGAAIYTLLKDFIAIKTDNWILYLGIVLLVIVLVLPEGVLGAWKKWQMKRASKQWQKES